MAYSADLRNKALNYYEQCKNISQTAATFNIVKKHALPVDSTLKNKQAA